MVYSNHVTQPPLKSVISAGAEFIAAQYFMYIQSAYPVLLLNLTEHRPQLEENQVDVCYIKWYNTNNGMEILILGSAAIYYKGIRVIIMRSSEHLTELLTKAAAGSEDARLGLQEILDPENTVYLTGDTHGVFNRVIHFCKEQETVRKNTFIVLGDAGINYGGKRDIALKKNLSKVPVTFFCIHGNHEQRPSPELGYELGEYHGGKVWVEPKYPNILFAIDGEVYEFCGQSCIVIGGAYSVDKWYRLRNGWGWWSDEQPSDETKAKVEQALTLRNWKVDVVLSHTCPLHYEPTEVFLPGLDQSKVDTSTEEWLDGIEQRLDYRYWYCGHFHTEKKIDKLQFMFNDFTLMPWHG